MASKVPVYTGDPAKCSYCIHGEYPHSHDVADLVAQEAPRATKTAHKPSNPVKAYNAMPRKVGRPMKPETWELLRVCECE